MRSLFLKVFLGFGLVVLMASIASFVTGIVIERHSQFPRASPLAQMFGVYAQSATEEYERDGKRGLSAYLERVERASGIRAVLFDSQGQELSGRTIPEGTEYALNRVDDDSPYVFYFFPQQPRPIAAHLARGSNGATYVLTAQLPRGDFPTLPPRLGEPGSFRSGLRIITRSFLPVLFVGALFCFWLARYLSAPIVQLRGVTQALAKGKLRSRVSGSLTKRPDEIGHLGRDFNVMAGRVESLVEAQNRLLGDISHELRSPLARMGVALALARRQSGSEAAASLDRIEREAQRLNELIGQLLTLSRLESGAEPSEKTSIDLAAVVKEVAEDADFEARGHDRSVLVVKNEPLTMNGVPDLVRSAIENIVRNAVRCTDAGTAVDISLTAESVAGHPVAVVKVRDHGRGVPEGSIKEIFRPFYRVEDDRDRKTGGAGLGLSIAARAVRLHHGTINASNATDDGLIVEIRLPINE